MATGTGYATLRFANQNGRRADGSYGTNVYIDKVVSRGGGRGVFCVSESGGAQINNVDLASNGNNAGKQDDVQQTSGVLLILVGDPSLD